MALTGATPVCQWVVATGALSVSREGGSVSMPASRCRFAPHVDRTRSETSSARYARAIRRLGARGGVAEFKRELIHHGGRVEDDAAGVMPCEVPAFLLPTVFLSLDDVERCLGVVA